MPNVGLFLDIGDHMCGTAEALKQRITAKFQVPGDIKLKLFRMTPIEADEYVASSNLVVASLPGSKMRCDTIEEVIETNRLQEETIVSLRIEIAQLRRKLAQSDGVRQEALATVNQLRSEFIHLIEEIHPKNTSSTARSQVLHKQPSQTPAPQSARKSDSNKKLPRLCLSGLRN